MNFKVNDTVAGKGYAKGCYVPIENRTLPKYHWCRKQVTAEHKIPRQSSKGKAL